MGLCRVLSVNITAERDGFFPDQAVYAQDMLNTWSMNARRVADRLEDVSEDPRAESEPGPRDVQQAQRFAGGLNWLPTITRPDLSCAVSQTSSAVARAPQQAIARAKKVFRYM